MPLSTHKKENTPVAFVHCSMNNTMASFIDSQGKVLFSLSSGILKYKGANKGSRVASQHVVQTMGTLAQTRGYHNIIVKLRGYGKGRNFIIKELTKLGINVVKIVAEDRVPFNGCREKKRKR